ncbi:hypothetical protein POJ06DRAFT_261540 [Lipomyces tetrasporus]|uniref:dolichol kinase n=1 Tax=Lipomyces tetrasporus TaxID=54092 RepID=A0AAD7QLP3_9ASCO|nr:uncharacterized protein POJ06DRAFT_261540 [Lipomyces tetrasporus]KAJ8097498.1 hypothetical protein POJ06DRAFT_261540 [Lipomyces tetrasporus]
MSLFTPAFSLTESRRSSKYVASVAVSPKSSLPSLVRSSLETSTTGSSSRSSSFLSPDISAEVSPESRNVTDDDAERQPRTVKTRHAGHGKRARRRRARHHRYSPTRSNVKVLDGVKDGYNLGFRKKCVESFLIVGALALAVQHNWAAILENANFVGICALILVAVLLVRQNYWTMPSVLYIYLFPIILTLTDYPQYLPLNLLLSMSALPLPTEILSNLVVAVSPHTAGVYYLYSNVTEIVSTLTTTSLSPAETSLAGTLLVNLLLNAKQMDMVFLRAFLFGSLFSLWPATPFVLKIMQLTRLPRHRRPAESAKLKMKYAYATYAIFVVNVLVFVRWHLQSSLGRDPFAYMIDYLFLSEESNRRLGMLGYWATWLAIGIPWIQRSSNAWTIDIRRKVWHGMVIGMFLPTGVGWDATFTSLSMAIALTLFLFSEFLRATTIPPLGMHIHDALKKYIDERDTCGPIVVSHIFLLLGISVPIFLSSSPAGIICLGFGDACASIIGRRVGKHRWFDSKKTLEGTAGFIAAAFTGLMITKYVLSGYDNILGPDLTVQWALLAAISTAVLEATSGMNDNVIVPVYMYVILRLGTRSQLV